VALRHRQQHGSAALALPPGHSNAPAAAKAYNRNEHHRIRQLGTPGESSRSCRTPDQCVVGWSARDRRPETSAPSRLAFPAPAARACTSPGWVCCQCTLRVGTRLVGISSIPLSGNLPTLTIRRGSIRGRCGGRCVPPLRPHSRRHATPSARPVSQVAAIGSGVPVTLKGQVTLKMGTKKRPQPRTGARWRTAS
jgi:hypothetical protein